MKKLLLLALASLLIYAGPVYAGFDEGNNVLRDSSGTLMSSYALTNGSAVRTETIDIEKAAGFSSIVVSVDASGDVDIYTEYSYDGTNWFVAYVSDMQGTINPEGVSGGDGLIVEQLTNVTNRYIAFTIRPSRYMRFVFDPDANSTITASFSYIVDR